MHSLLLDAIIFLSAAVVLVPLASRLKLGSVLGYLVAGCLMGPFGFGFVEDVQTIMHAAEFGVVLMLFLLGLELDPKRLWGMRRSVFGGGSLQMALTGVLLIGGGLVAGLPIKGAIVAGLALALSSTAIAVQIMRERGVLSAPLGKSAFSILLFQDMAAIPLIGIVPLLAEQTENSHSGSPWIGLGKVVGAIFLVVVVGRYATRPVLRGIAKTNLREVFTAFALLLVIGIAYLMELAGVSMALGAFLAGVLLAGSEYRHALETDIEPFKGLLMGLFFMTVGMSIDFGLLRSQWLLLLLLTTGFAILKCGALYLVATRAKVPAGQRFLFTAVLSQGGEFAFVVLGIARVAKLLPGDWEKILTLVVALSMALTPILVLLSGVVDSRKTAPRPPEDIVEAEDAPVIIAGFGRFGQIVGRLLFASRLRATVLDFDPDQIELLRRFGFRVFYGDATRLDLLKAAGIRHAKILVNAIDDVETNLKLTKLVREHYPNLEIVARARNMSHWYDLRALGVTVVEREVYETALLVGRRALESLGVRPNEARERAERFRRHNLAAMEALRPGAIDEKKRTQLAQDSRDELERQFQRDQEALDRDVSDHWSARPEHPDGLVDRSG